MSDRSPMRTKVDGKICQSFREAWQSVGFPLIATARWRHHRRICRIEGYVAVGEKTFLWLDHPDNASASTRSTETSAPAAR